MMYVEIARLCWPTVGKQRTFETDQAKIDLKIVQQYHRVIKLGETTVVCEIVVRAEECETVVAMYDVVVNIVVEV